MTEILLSVSPLVFSWIMLGRGSSSVAFLLPCPEKGVVWPIPPWTHPTRVAVVVLMVTDLVSISRNAATGRPREGICPPPFWMITQSVQTCGRWGYFISSPNKLKICHTIKQLYIHNIMPKHENNTLQKKFYNQFKKSTFSVEDAPCMGHTRHEHGSHLTGQKSWVACIA